MTVKPIIDVMDWNEINSMVGVLAFVFMVCGGLLKVYADQIRMKQKVSSNQQRHDSTDEIVKDLKESHHDVVRRQDVTESKLIDHKEILNKMDSKLDQLLNLNRNK